jgi:hypothetical protein
VNAIILNAYSRYHIRMNIRPAPTVPGDTEAERMDNAVQKLFTTPKQEMQLREAEWQRTKQGKAK